MTGLLFKRDGKFYFSTMTQVPANFDIQFVLNRSTTDGQPVHPHGERILSSEVAGFSHTHPAPHGFSAKDALTPAKYRLPSFMRNSQGIVYRWDGKGAIRYRDHLAAISRASAVGNQMGREEVQDPASWGISRVCIGGGECD